MHVQHSAALPRDILPALRWTARIWSLASILLILAILVGERSLPSTRNEWLGFLFFPAGISAGMLVAWRSELLGGVITVASLCAFYLLHYVTAGAFPTGAAWLVITAPGFLFVVTSLRSRRRISSAT